MWVASLWKRYVSAANWCMNRRWPQQIAERPGMYKVEPRSCSHSANSRHKMPATSFRLDYWSLLIQTYRSGMQPEFGFGVHSGGSSLQNLGHSPQVRLGVRRPGGQTSPSGVQGQSQSMGTKTTRSWKKTRKSTAQILSLIVVFCDRAVPVATKLGGGAMPHPAPA